MRRCELSLAFGYHRAIVFACQFASRLMKNAHLRRALSSFLVVAAYFYVRLTSQNLSAENADSPRSMRGSPVSGALYLAVFEQPASKEIMRLRVSISDEKLLLGSQQFMWMSFRVVLGVDSPLQLQKKTT